MDEKSLTFSGVIVTPARMDVPTLPGRPLRPLGNSTVLGEWIKRARLVSPNVRLIVTTSNAECDRPILEYCLDSGIPCVIDSVHSPASHLAETISSLGCTAVAVGSLSNPFIEPALLCVAFQHQAETQADYVTFSGLPAGSAVEVLSLPAYAHLAEGGNCGQPLSASVLPAPFDYSMPKLSCKCETETDYLKLVSLYSDRHFNKSGNLHEFS